MSSPSNPALVADRDSLPLKKRDQRPSSPPQQQQQCDDTTFKAPYPYKSQNEYKTRHSSLFQPIPRRVSSLYQPWMQTQTSSRSKPHVLSAFREHHGWAEWRDMTPLHPGWDLSHHYQLNTHLSEHPREAGHYPSHLRHPSRFSPVSIETGGFHRFGAGYSWEQLKTLRDKGSSTERDSNGRSKAPYVRRKDRKSEYLTRGEKASTCLPHSAFDDLTLQQNMFHKASKIHNHSVSKVCPGDNLKSTYTSMTEDSLRPSLLPPTELTCASSSSSSSSSPSHFPWLLPHFLAGSLIELRDGQLRRVEHLQTEDFLLGSLACPDLRLSCCTVQSISPSASSATISRLLILLHDQQSQELVDVYVEYPFFVRERGWSSCSPQRTARLCGLKCRQLSVGDVCLALTPVSAPTPRPSANLEPTTPPGRSEGGCEPLEVSHPHTALSTKCSSGPQRPAAGQRKEPEGVRRRHYSAPELRRPGTNCT
ncbi:uncharacterized protein LOC115419769 [Sphaeramia orbicularis]|uniref:Uncharacterized LOC115419769 n=1 Tax=Sphaeramia orbicularis TaxID=375764 RepID=A0A673A8Z5_9TELE|nr:uncharacterized protein LOC115419769 [Sphaeramia orbicularis]